MITALTDFYYNKSSGHTKEEIEILSKKYKIELDKLTKTNAMKIVEKQLEYYGIQGAYFDGFFDAATDMTEHREFWRNSCTEWVDNKYPTLN